MERPAAEESLMPERNLWMRNGELRIAWKMSAFIGAFLLIAFVFMAASLFLNQASMLVFSIGQTGAAFGASVFCMLLIEQRPLADIGLWLRTPAWRAFCIGNGLAAAMVFMVFAVELSTGLARTIVLSLEIESSINILAFGLVQFGLVAVGEEVLTRGYPFHALQRRYNGIVAILTTSVVFSIMHAANPSVTVFALVNIFLAGIWLGAARILSGGLWLPIGMHLSWNFVLGPVLGYPVSGIVEASILRTEAQGPLWITGGYFGPEGGTIVTVVLVAGALALLHPALRRRYAFTHSANNEQEIPENAT